MPLVCFDDWGAFIYPDLMRKVLPAKVNYKP
jgi:hypothetical protein